MGVERHRVDPFEFPSIGDLPKKDFRRKPVFIHRRFWRARKRATMPTQRMDPSVTATIGLHVSLPLKEVVKSIPVRARHEDHAIPLV